MTIAGIAGIHRAENYSCLVLLKINYYMDFYLSYKLSFNFFNFLPFFSFFIENEFKLINLY